MTHNHIKTWKMAYSYAKQFNREHTYLHIANTAADVSYNIKKKYNEDSCLLGYFTVTQR